MEPVFMGEWPNPYYMPKGIACHPTYGTDKMLVANKYSVHALQLQEGGGQFQNVLTKCLTENVGFRARGFDGLSLKCSNERCWVLLFSRNGMDALRCPLDTLGGTLENSSRLLVHGGQWRALSSGFQDIVWGVSDRALVQFQSLKATPTEFVPRHEVPLSAARKVAQLHSISQNAVLALESSGRLHAWFVGSGVSTWQLPSGTWAGVCMAGDSLYFVGSVLGGSPAVWRAASPTKLNPGEMRIHI